MSSTLSLFMLELCLFWSCTGILHPVTNMLSLYVQLSCCVWKTLFICIHLLCLLQSSYPLIQRSMNLSKKGRDTDIPVRVKNFTVSILFTLSVVGLRANHLQWQKQLFFWVLRAALISGYTNKSLGVGLIPFPFSRTLVAESSLSFMTCLDAGSWPQ